MDWLSASPPTTQRVSTEKPRALSPSIRSRSGRTGEPVSYTHLLLLDETDFYIALPQYLDSVVRIPLDAASFAEEDFYPAPAIEQMDPENAAALLNACTALLGDCLLYTSAAPGE